MINKNTIIKEFSLKAFGSQGWFKGKLYCPKCGRNDKYGIFFTEDSGIVHCFHDGYKNSLFNHLKEINRLDLVDGDNYIVELKKSLEPLKTDEIEREKTEVKMPLGFRRINFDEYLFGRGFIEKDYEKFGIGVASLDPRTENKIVFTLKQNNEIVGWMARSRNDYEWHKENLRKYKLGEEELVLRYCNSGDGFSEILGGYDDINEKTHTVILVEGLMDKANVDRLMGLDDIDEVKCCFTFGADVSQKQVDLLILKRNVEDIILLYDSGTINQVKSGGARLIPYYDVKVGVITDPDVDPGNINKNYLLNIISNLQNFYYFYKNQLS